MLDFLFKYLSYLSISNYRFWTDGILDCIAIRLIEKLAEYKKYAPIMRCNDSYLLIKLDETKRGLSISYLSNSSANFSYESLYDR